MVFKKQVFPLLFCLIVVSACVQKADKKYKEGAFVEIFDNEALEIIDPDSGIEVLGEGYTWTEGPLWIEDGQYLLFSDIPSNKVHKIDAQGNNSLFLESSGYTGSAPRGGEKGSNALLLDNNGSLVLMQHGDRRVAKMNSDLDNPKPDFTTLVGTYDGKRLNSPNDGVFDKEGNLYFTDPPYGLEKKDKDPVKEIPFQGVYFLDTDGDVILLDSTVTRPNGIRFSPDEKKLYLAVSDPEHSVWYQYSVPAPGEINDKQLLYDATHLVGKEGEKGLPDGLKVNSAGYIFATGPGGVWIFNPQGKPIAKIRTGEATSNCDFSADEKWLYITADNYVLRVNLF